ncbi:uncharacterized membrane protein YuzA (DUF378 family) [Arthrobacter stackebrandtii]|uniref:Uncharacterized membrane protein YuzA (DUF378 family) n=1 Tax=Arthrobacter stackebrandtii TaxID=272161 RepID=A0ABS4Z2K4_9MICC|nr:hypothetical protein [Arthrobacter stackebrandtii]MBP2414493.1 uncharacterized membrane protein YuzA (DUF378 family) [Arthrobacter stackebrandtii]PYH01614.1 hypothetical protein CVV67_03850 [Arthrobacter stackebrandtii]
MNFDTALNWTAIGLLAVAFTARLVMVQTHRHQEKMVFTFSQRVGLPVGSEQIHATLVRRLRSSANAALLGGMAGALAASGWYVAAGISGLPLTFVWLVAMPAILVGVTAFDVALAVRDSLFGRQADGLRIARLEVVGRGDYLSPVRLWTAPVLLGLAAALVVADLVLGGSLEGGAAGFVRGAVLPLLVAAAILVVLCAVVAGKILERPQRAANKLELAWDDAARADALRKLGLLASVVAWLAASGAVLSMLNGIDAARPGTTGNSVGEWVSVWGYYVIVFLYSYGGAYTWFRRRLWPNPAELGRGSLAAGPALP